MMEVSLRKFTKYPHDSPFYGLVAKIIPPPLEEIIPRTLIVCMDVSLSMTNYEHQLKESVKRIVEGVYKLSNSTEVVIIPFSSDIKFVWSSKKKEITVEEMLSQLKCDGRTNIEIALNTAYGECNNREGWKWILLLSDGNPTMGISDPYIFNIAAKKSKIVHRCVGYGNNYSSELLYSIGRVSHIDSMDDCSTIFSGILLEVIYAKSYVSTVQFLIKEAEGTGNLFVSKVKSPNCIIDEHVLLFFLEDARIMDANQNLIILYEHDGVIEKIEKKLGYIILEGESDGTGWLMTYPRDRNLEKIFYNDQVADMITAGKSNTEVINIVEEWANRSDETTKTLFLEIVKELGKINTSRNTEGSSLSFVQNAQSQRSYFDMGTQSEELW